MNWRTHNHTFLIFFLFFVSISKLTLITLKLCVPRFVSITTAKEVMFVSNLKYKKISELIIHMLNLVQEEAGEALNLNIALIPSTHN